MEEENRLSSRFAVLGVRQNTTIAEYHTTLGAFTNHGIVSGRQRFAL